MNARAPNKPSPSLITPSIFLPSPGLGRRWINGADGVLIAAVWLVVLARVAASGVL